MARVSAVMVVVALACVLSGCITTSAGVAPCSRPLDADRYTVLGASSGTSWGVELFGILPVAQARTADALDDALRSRGADALVQVTTDNRMYYLLILTMQRIKVEGLGVKSK